MSIAFLPYGFLRKHFCRLAEIRLDQLEWPLGDGPPDAVPTDACVADLTENDHLIVVANSRIFTMRQDGVPCSVSILLCEPPVIQGRLYAAVPYVAQRFRYVLTHSTRLLERVANARFVAHGGSMISQHQQPIIEKTARCGIIASDKNSTAGHRLRHRIIEDAVAAGTQLTTLGRGYEALERKEDGHLPFCFSVVIENCREPGYFTEKLIDSFLCNSVPIYWGAPDIEHFFDPRGMVICRSQAELINAVRSLKESDFASFDSALAHNRSVALQYADYFPRAAAMVQSWDQDRERFSGGASESFLSSDSSTEMRVA